MSSDTTISENTVPEDSGEKPVPDMPTSEQVQKELDRNKYKKGFFGAVRSTIYILITVAAVAVLVAVLLLPVLRIYGTSMTPNLTEGDIVLSVKRGTFETGEIVAFYYNNKILVKRVIAHEGDWVDIDDAGNVYVNGVMLDEPYVTDKSFGDYTDITLPYQVPESRIFVMGDHRSTSVDSRSTSIGPVSEEQIVGKIVFRVWPFKNIGKVE